jgi:hypothetical protein
MPELRAELRAPCADKVRLVGTSVHDIRTKDVERSNLSPSLLTQVLRIDTEYVPSLAVADFVHEVAASDTRFCNCLVTVRKGRDIEFIELEDLHKVHMSVGDQYGSYNIRSQAFRQPEDPDTGQDTEPLP